LAVKEEAWSSLPVEDMSFSHMPNNAKTRRRRFSCGKTQAEDKISIKIEIKGERASRLDGNVYSVTCIS
jgi:hypothetical protein